MVGAKTGVATRMNEIESRAHLTHYHGHALETIKVIKIIRGTLDAAFGSNTLQIISKKTRSFQWVERRHCTGKSWSQSIVLKSLDVQRDIAAKHFR